MLDLLDNNEKEVLFMLIQGHNFCGISELCYINYNEFKKIKQSIFKKLSIKRSTEILIALLQHGINVEEI